MVQKKNTYSIAKASGVDHHHVPLMEKKMYVQDAMNIVYSMSAKCLMPCAWKQAPNPSKHKRSMPSPASVSALTFKTALNLLKIVGVPKTRA
jgi:hypothetical protein